MLPSEVMKKIWPCRKHNDNVQVLKVYSTIIALQPWIKHVPIAIHLYIIYISAHLLRPGTTPRGSPFALLIPGSASLLLCLLQVLPRINEPSFNGERNWWSRDIQCIGSKWIFENLSANRLKSSDYNWFAKCLSRENLRAGLPSFELFLHFLSLLLFFLELVLSHKSGNSKNLIWLLNTDLLKKRMQLRSKEAKGQPLVIFSTFSERFKLSPAANVRVESQKTNSHIL